MKKYEPVQTKEPELEGKEIIAEEQALVQKEIAVEEDEQESSQKESNVEIQDKGKLPSKLQPTDGVFSNLSAKPSPSTNPLDNPSKDSLPTYAEVEQNPLPDYSQITLYLPQQTPNGILVNGLPVGSVFAFLCSLVFSFTFQLLGFMLAFILSQSNAGRIGARVGFGFNLVYFGVSVKNKSQQDYGSGEDDVLSFVVIVVGWFVVVQGLVDYFKVRRMERIMSARGTSEV